MVTEWLIYRGTGIPHDAINDLPPPPPWRDFDGGPVVRPAAPLDATSKRRLGVMRRQAEGHRPSVRERELVNAALYLRRPLLVTGDPGTGKSTLAHAVAHELGLGRVLAWSIVSRTPLRDGLYLYDAMGRLQDLQFERAVSGSSPHEAEPGGGIGRYVSLGPLGTALLPSALPRVLLIDELDKSDIDLPNDLLNVLEEGEFTIPELVRIADRAPDVEVLCDDGTPVTIHRGRVRCRAFPFIVMTSNGERDFPAPLLRRCLHLELEPPDRERLADMVHAHFGEGATERYGSVIEDYLNRAPGDIRAIDQLLNAIQLASQTEWPEDDDTRRRLTAELMRPLDRVR